MNILDRIIAEKRQIIARDKEMTGIAVLEKMVQEMDRTNISFKKSLTGSQTGIIAEFKRRSPSRDWIFRDAQIDRIIPVYTSGGASAISVLTDEPFFGGTLTDLQTARQLTDIPLLRKDFIIDDYQVFQAKAYGADVILLIASALTPLQTKQLSEVAKNLGLEVLLEIHSDNELDHIHQSVDVVGINNRNLSTFVTDTKVSFDLGGKIPDDYVKISESGISDPQVVRELRQAGFRGFLMGENFMKTDDPGKALGEFIASI